MALDTQAHQRSCDFGGLENHINRQSGISFRNHPVGWQGQ
jgi:hypothetical protein